MFVNIIGLALLFCMTFQISFAMEENDIPNNNRRRGSITGMKAINNYMRRNSLTPEHNESSISKFQQKKLKRKKSDLGDIDWHKEFHHLLGDFNASISGDIKDNKNQAQFMHLYMGLSRFLKAKGLDSEIERPLLGITGRVLSIAGGGIKGISAAEWLKTLENNVSSLREEQTLVKDMVHLAGGTSTGGILAAFATLPLDNMTMAKAQKFYFDHAKDIFDEQAFNLGGTTYAKYGSSGLLNVAYETIGMMRLSDCVVPTVITAYDGTNRSMKFFSSEEAKNDISENYYMLDVLRATSAAPTYFPPVKIYNAASGTKRDFFNRFKMTEGACKMGGLGAYVPPHLVRLGSIANPKQYPDTLRASVMLDGGLNVNNPSMQMLVEAAKNWGPVVNELIMINVGTGNSETPLNYEDIKGGGALKYIQKGKLFEVMLDQDFVDGQIDGIAHALPHIKHFNLEVNLKDGSMDNTSEEFMNNLQSETQKEIRGASKDMVKELSEILAKPLISLPSYVEYG